MYRYTPSSQITTDKLALPGSRQGVVDQLRSLEADPFEKSKQTNAPALGSYYINAGSRYAVLFDVDSESKEIHVHKILRQATLHRILQNINQ